MAELPGASTTLDAQAAAGAAGINYLAIIAAVATGADFVPRVYTNPAACLSVHGYSDGAEYLSLHTAETRKACLFMPVPIAAPGVVGRKDTSGNAGSSVVDIVEGPDGALGETDGILRVAAGGGGTVGTDQIKLELSLDGGRNFQKVRLGTANTYTLRDKGGNDMGLRATFGAGTLVAGNTLISWHSSGPRWDQAGLEGALASLAGSSKRARSWLVVGDLAVEDDATDVLAQLEAFETTYQRFTLARCQLRDRLPFAELSHVTNRMTGAPNVTFAEVGAGNDTVTRSAGSFSADGFTNGDTVRITGAVAGAGHNNITGVATVTSPTVLTFASSSVDFDNEGPIADVSMTAEPTLTFVDGGGGSDLLQRNRGSWIADGFRVGDSITITGTASNNVTKTITALSATQITVATASFAAEVVGIRDVAIVAGESKAAWIADLDEEFADVRGEDEFRLDLTVGRAAKTSPLTGFAPRRPAAWAVTIREYQHDIHIASWQKDLGPLAGWDLENTDGELVEFNEAVDGGALAAGFTCLRTWNNGPSGTFVASALTRAEDGSSVAYTHNAHVANLCCSLVQAATENAVGRSLVLNADNTATSDSLAKITAEVQSVLEDELLTDKLKEGQRASSVKFTPATDDDLSPGQAEPPTLNTTTELNLRGTIVQVRNTVRVQ